MGIIRKFSVSAGILVLFLVFLYNEAPLSVLDGTFGTEDRKTDEPSVPVPVMKQGLAQWIGKSGAQVENTFGKPSRIDPSAYGYDWWVYDQYERGYLQIGVADSKVVTVFALGKNLDIAPLHIGEARNQAISSFSMQSTVTIRYDGGSYRFRLKKSDLEARPLVKVGNDYAILYFDTFTDRLQGIRYMNAETTIRLQPYSVTYRGHIRKPKIESRKQWRPIEEGEERQIAAVSNRLRQRYGLSTLKWHDGAARAAYLHSKDMAVNDYFAHVSPTEGDLGDRLHEAGVRYVLAGENIAAGYVDGLAAVYGWLNSEGHRENLFRHSFTAIGVGVYEKYYTQDFVTPF
ncbi:MAG TPA: CAP domain-containing protein [Bacillales bacterium]|nr:CAP domain-containing protein [Bacillales bacterium]